MDSYAFGFIGILLWLLLVGISLFVSYWVIRLAVFHAMKSHTKWLQGGQR